MHVVVSQADETRGGCNLQFVRTWYLYHITAGVHHVVVVVVVVVLTLTRIIKSVVTRQALATLEWRNTPRKNTQTKSKVVHAYITADAVHVSARRMI